MQLHVKLRPASIDFEAGGVPELYRIAARKKITELLAENRRLRHGLQPQRGDLTRFLERLFLAWLERRYPLPPEGRVVGDVDVLA